MRKIGRGSGGGASATISAGSRGRNIPPGGGSTTPQRPLAATWAAPAHAATARPGAKRWTRGPRQAKGRGSGRVAGWKARRPHSASGVACSHTGLKGEPAVPRQAKRDTAAARSFKGVDQGSRRQRVSGAGLAPAGKPFAANSHAAAAPQGGRARHPQCRAQHCPQVGGSDAALPRIGRCRAARLRHRRVVAGCGDADPESLQAPSTGVSRLLFVVAFCFCAARLAGAAWGWARALQGWWEQT